jgi:hypothetical protein
MARYPSNPGKWVDQSYANYGDAWETAKEQCRALLYDWAKLCEPHSYSELTQHITAIPWPDGAHTHAGSQIGRLLGQVSMEELDPVEDRPVMSALVYGYEEGMPSGGFWSLLRDELCVDVPELETERRKFWKRELDWACSYYGGKSTSP